MAIKVVKKSLLSIMKYYKEAIKEKARNKYKNLTEEEKKLKRQYSREKYKKLKNNSFQQYKR